MDFSINGAKVLYEIENVPLLGTVQITQTLTVSVLVLIIVWTVSIWLGSGLKVTDISRKQAVAEMIVTALVNFVRSNMGTQFDHYIPLVGTIFITSVISNLISLVGFWSPTADLMTELAWALVVFAVITFHKIRSAGPVGYIRNFFRLDPGSGSVVTKILGFFMAPLNVMSELFTPISMACRHFGNILSGTVIGALIYAALTVASSALFSALSSSLTVGILVTALGLFPAVFGHIRRKKLPLIGGSIAAITGLLALITGLGVKFPFLTVGLPAIPSLYFDWFGGCIQAFIFCTLTTLFIKQAADG